MKIDKGYDAKAKATTFTMSKTENGKTTILRIVDRDKSGNDGILAVGDNTSIFTKDDVLTLMNEYAGATTSVGTAEDSKLTPAEYTVEDGQKNLKKDKEYSLTSYAKAMGATLPAPTVSTANVTSQYNLPNGLTTGSKTPLLDTSMFEGYGAAGQTTTGFENFNMGRYQEAARYAQGVGSLIGMLTSMGSSSDMISAMLPLMMNQMLPKVNFFNTPSAIPAPAATVDNQAAASGTDSASTEKKGNEEVVSSTVSSSSDVVSSTKKEYEQMEKTRKAKIQTEVAEDGSYVEKYTNEKGIRIIDHRNAKGELVRTGAYNKVTKESRFENYETGKIVKLYTDKNGKRVAEEWNRKDYKKGVKVTHFTGNAEKAAAGTAGRAAKVDVRIKELNTQLAAAQVALDHSTPESYDTAQNKLWETKAEIKKLNAIKNSPELKKLDAEFEQAKKDLKNATSKQENDNAQEKLRWVKARIDYVQSRIS